MSALTLFGYTPPARYDSVAWVSARIEESATETGSYTEVETVDLFPVDVDPRLPMIRGFTTEDATEGYFYRVVWIGSDAVESIPTPSVQYVTVVSAFATRAELKSLLKITNTDSDDALDRVLLAAAGEVLSEIGGENAAALSGWKTALAAEVNLERAAEHWAQLKSPFGFVGLGNVEIHSTPAIAARDSWDRHAYKLAPIKSEWGIA